MTEKSDRRLFLGWDGQVVDLVVEYLMEGRQVPEGEPVDLGDLLVVTPTRQAARRLREALACWCDSRGSTLVSAKVVTPNYLFAGEKLPANVASGTVVRGILAELLMGVDLSELEALFPVMGPERSFQWALNTADIIDRLRQELGDAASTIRDVVESKEEKLEEVERWLALARLEEMYLAKLAEYEFQDPCVAKIECADRAGESIEAEKVVVACVPDPSLLAIRALESVSASTIVEVLVHAPEARSDDFDSWGRPVSENWVTAEIGIPGFDENVFLEAGAPEQSRRVLDEIRNSSEDFESGEVAIGVPDRSAIAFLKKDLGAEGLPPFDPSDLNVAEHSIGRLAQQFHALVQTESYEAVAGFLRHADVAEYLDRKHGISVLDTLTQLDEFQNYYLPIAFPHMLEPFKGNPKGTTEWRDDFTELGKALNVAKTLYDEFGKQEFEEAWRSFFCEIYSVRMIERARIEDLYFESAAVALDKELRELRKLDAVAHDLSREQLSALFVSRLSKATFHAERRNEVIDLEGWLELPWNSRPFLLIAGMNDDFVPGGSLSDAFLPDSLRAELGLRDDRARLARDIFLFTGMVESRRTGGRVCVAVAKAGSSGDPLRPSRLLFRCADKYLCGRAEKLLAPVKNPRPRHASDVIFQLKPGEADRKNDIQEKKYISVTAFRDYLQCPFRFCLKHMLGMEKQDDRKTGLDHLDFGSIVHEVLEVMGKDEALWKMGDAAKLGDALAELAEGYVRRRFAEPLPLSVHVSLLSAVQRLRGVARVQVALVKDGWDIIEAEAGHDKETRERWRLKRQGFTISGKIDRIDQHRDTGHIRIIDYKTSDTAKGPHSIHYAGRKDDAPDWNRLVTIKQLKNGPKEDLKQWKDLQLPIYAMIYAKGGSVPEGVGLAYFNIPKAVSQTGVYEWQGLNDNLFSSAAACVDGVLEAIAAGEFWPPAGKVKYDDFTDLFHTDPALLIDSKGVAI